jgi:multidrug resistance efflux pump
VSREELARKQMEYDVAAAECLQAQMTKQREQIECDMAVAELERRTIRAPMDGGITEIKIREGEGCEIRQPLISLADASEVEFSANVEAAVLARFSVGQVVDLVLDDESGGEVLRPATIYHVAPVVDRASGLGLMKATFHNADRSIRPGVPARIKTPSP